VKDEWLYKVVVGSSIQAMDAILDVVFRSKNENGRGVTCATKLPNQVKTVAVRKHPVKQDCIGTFLHGDAECLGKIRRLKNLIAFLPQTAA
jgi:hypothetical protein